MCVEEPPTYENGMGRAAGRMDMIVVRQATALISLMTSDGGLRVMR